MNDEGQAPNNGPQVFRPNDPTEPQGVTSTATQQQVPVPEAPAQFQPATPLSTPFSQATDDNATQASVLAGNPTEDGTQVRPHNGSPIISWTAAEFIVHKKGPGWFLTLAGVIVVVSVAVYLLTKDKISTATILICGILFGVYAVRRPRQLQYQLDDAGISIGQKFYSYEQFRSFSVVDDGAFSSILFMPLKRFAPLLTIYYDPADEEAIANLLTDCLPLEEHKLDLIDQFMRRIRF
jgi:hypothetical protein